MSVQLNRYHEDLITDTDAYDVTVQVETGDGHAVDVGATVEDGVATITSLGHADRDELPRRSFPAAVEAVAELRDRGYDVDVGPLGRLVERQQEPDVSEAPDTDSDADDQDEDDVDKVWCGICGDGPYTKFGIHHGKKHKEQERVELDHEPEPNELVQDDNVEDDVGENDQGDEASVTETLQSLERGDKVHVEALRESWTSGWYVVSRIDNDDGETVGIVVSQGGGTEPIIVEQTDNGVTARREKDDETVEFGDVHRLDHTGQVSRQKRLQMAQPEELGLAPMGERMLAGGSP